MKWRRSTEQSYVNWNAAVDLLGQCFFELGVGNSSLLHRHMAWSLCFLARHVAEIHDSRRHDTATVWHPVGLTELDGVGFSSNLVHTSEKVSCE